MADQAAWQRLQPSADKIIPQAVKGGLKGLAERDQTLFLVWSATAEFDNGGFAQFFFNSAGSYSAATVAALRRIGAEQVAELLKQAMEVFPDGSPPMDNDERNAALDDLSEVADERFEELDARFQEIGSDAVMEQLARYYLGDGAA